MSSKLIKKSLLKTPGLSVKTPRLKPPQLALRPRRPPTTTFISEALRFRSSALSTTISLLKRHRPFSGSCGSHRRKVPVPKTIRHRSVPEKHPYGREQREHRCCIRRLWLPFQPPHIRPVQSGRPGIFSCCLFAVGQNCPEFFPVPEALFASAWGCWLPSPFAEPDECGHHWPLLFCPSCGRWRRQPMQCLPVLLQKGHFRVFVF